MQKVKRKNTQQRKRGYARICLKKRKMLVKLVHNQGESISSTIKKLKIKLTTARLILQKYKETGTFPMRKFKKVGKMLLDLPEYQQSEEDEAIVKKQQTIFIKQQFESEMMQHPQIKEEECISQQSQQYDNK